MADTSVEAEPQSAAAPTKPGSPIDDTQAGDSSVSDATLDGMSSVSDTYPDLPSTVARVRAPGAPFGGTSQDCEVFLVGTAHVSSASCDDVRKVISTVRPQVVVLELCEERRAVLLASKTELKPYSLQQLMALIRRGVPLMQVGVAWMSSRVGEALDVMPGEELRVAVEEARKVGAKVVLGDRKVSITIARAWAALSLWQRVRFFTGLLYCGIFPPNSAEVENLKTADGLIESLLEFSEEFPGIVGPLLEERNKYMVLMLHQIARVCGEASSIVAVVGAGHVRGMIDVWHDDICLEELVKMPKKKQPGFRWGRMVVITGCLCVTGLILVKLRRRR